MEEEARRCVCVCVFVAAATSTTARRRDAPRDVGYILCVAGRKARATFPHNMCTAVSLCGSRVCVCYASVTKAPQSQSCLLPSAVKRERGPLYPNTKNHPASGVSCGLIALFSLRPGLPTTIASSRDGRHLPLQAARARLPRGCTASSGTRTRSCASAGGGARRGTRSRPRGHMIW